MSARILNGTRHRSQRFAPSVAAWSRRRSPRGRDAHRASGIVLVGDDPASEIYVRNKVKAGTESGLRVDLQRLPRTAALPDLLALVERV